MTALTRHSTFNWMAGLVLVGFVWGAFAGWLKPMGLVVADQVSPFFMGVTQEVGQFIASLLVNWSF